MIRVVALLMVPLVGFVLTIGVIWFRRIWGLAALERKIIRAQTWSVAQVRIQKLINESFERDLADFESLLAADSEAIPFLTTSQRAAIERIVTLIQQREEP